ncbi:MAG: DNA translocase FtsK 4TM domain-containing protein [Deltaproteobacteria bacterium]|jgi:S-DNA-T family DNA segregation ATPase FtsK/SpoIIIE|nr:DNA translocase FtsK 4TM domain-containing protein [Deltaproteobacteria bacterium]
MAGQKNKKKTASYKARQAPAVPVEVPALGALILAVIIVLALFSHQAGDLSAGPAKEFHNHIGLFGAHLSAVLIKWFGLASFWPAPIFFILSVIFIKGRSPRVSPFQMALGLSLAVFAVLALFAIIWPGPKLTVFWPGESVSGGGAVGSFLVRGLLATIGSVGSIMVLPLVFFVGFLVATGISLGSFFSAIGRFLSIFSSSGQGSQAAQGAQAWSGLESARGAKSEPGALKLNLTEDDGPKKGARRAKNSGKNSGPRDIGLDLDLDDHDALDLEPHVSQAPPEPLIVEKKRPAAKKVKSEAPKTVRGGPYELPPIDLLDPPDDKGPENYSSGLSHETLKENARLLETKLSEFGVEGRVLEVSSGPVITMYEFQPAPGIKISKIVALANDLAMAMRVAAVRVVAPIPGKAALGFELPNRDRATVTLREVMESQAFQSLKSPLSLVLGVDITGVPQVADLGRMPHLLIAGSTGSGKSVGLDCMIMSILYKARPDQVRFLLIDPKCVEMATYQDLPHLLHPVLTDADEANLALKWAVHEMDLRYKLMAEKGVRNITGFNDLVKKEAKESANPEELLPPMPYLVIIIDELSDLMLQAAKDVEVAITRLAAKARAAGIHLILATQRPSVDVLTGVIKANLPTRLSFQVTTKVDSKTILDRMGAEQLLGKGDMLFMPPGTAKLIRLHGAFVSDEEKKRVTDYIRQWGPPDYVESLVPPERGEDEGGGQRDDKYREAVEIVRREGKASISSVQRHLRIGYNRAARIIEEMERDGIIGPADGAKPRIVF